MIIELNEVFALPRRFSPALDNILKAHAEPMKRESVIVDQWTNLVREANRMDRDSGAQASNTYSGTLVTAYLMEGSITPLQNVWAPLAAFSRDGETDPFKPLAASILKNVTAGPTVQTDATNFESGDSTVGALTITPHQYTASFQVSNSDLNSGLRMRDLVTKAVANFSDKVIQVATAPIVAATFTATPIVVSAAAFNWSDMATARAAIKKSPIKNCILDGAYLARLDNIPTNYQDSGIGSGGRRTFGWDGIYESSNWTGAGANIQGFACNPQAIVAATGLPLAPSASGNVLSRLDFTLPNLQIAVSVFNWVNVSTRTAWCSYDIVAGFTAGDATAGVIISNGSPG